MYESGHVLGGWELLERIGRGGMGEVWRARHVTSSADAAVKVLFVRPDRRNEARERFAREVEAARHLDHRGVCAVLEWGEDEAGGALYIVMELLRGVSFRRWLDDTRGSPLTALELLRDVLDPLACAHEFRTDGVHAPIVHRDLKPENLFVLDGDVGERIKLLDFGIARGAGAEDITETGVGMGTAAYMSPEQATDARVVGPAADVWSLGVMLYEVVAGQNPFSSPSRNETISKILTRDPVPLETRVPGVPLPLGKLIRACLEKDASRRPPDATAVAKALDDILADPKQRAALEDLDTIEEPNREETVGATTRGAHVSRKTSSRIIGAMFWGGALLAVTAFAYAMREQSRRPSDGADAIVSSQIDLPMSIRDAGPQETNRWVRVEGGPAIRLGVSDDALDDGISGFRPRAEVYGETRPFLMMQHEVTFAELEGWLADDLESTTVRRPAWLPSERAARASYPATGVPWDVARRYCVERGADLPSEAEWERAARGPEGRAYAWGDAAPDPSRVNLGPDRHPAPVMTFAQDRTPGPLDVAIYDLTGNAREWTRDLFRNHDGSEAEWAASDERTFRVVRGVPLAIRSVWEPPVEAPIAHRVPLCATGPCPEGTDEVTVDVGFRCARPVVDDPPSRRSPTR